MFLEGLLFQKGTRVRSWENILQDSFLVASWHMLFDIWHYNDSYLGLLLGVRGHEQLCWHPGDPRTITIILLLSSLKLSSFLFWNSLVSRPKHGLHRWCSVKKSACQCRWHRRCEFDPWARIIPWRWKWQPTPGFLPKKSHVQRSLAGYSPWGHKESDTTEHACMHETCWADLALPSPEHSLSLSWCCFCHLPPSR